MPETPSERPFSEDFSQMFQEVLDNLKGLMPPKKAEDFEAQYEIGPTSIYDLHETFEPYGEAELQFGNYGTKVMMTPKEFLSLCLYPARKDRRQDDLEKYRKSFEQGIPLHIPALELKPYGEEGDWVVSGHEGRHRTQVLIDMGYGDLEIPISIWPQKYMGDPYSPYGENPKVNEVLKNIHIWPQSSYGDEMDEGNEMVFIHEDDITTNYETGEVIKLASEESFEANEKSIYHECCECGHKTEPKWMTRQQDRKCPKCKNEDWADVQTMIAYNDYEATNARRKKEMLENIRKIFEESGLADWEERWEKKKKEYEAEGWEDIDWEIHNPVQDPSPFDTIEWKELPPPPANIVLLMKAFEGAGYTILVVGGAVRDGLLKLPLKDYDLATNAKPDEIKEVVDGLKGYRYVLGPKAEKALRNLTSLVNIPNEKEAIEITTFRKEFGYKGGRTKGDFKPTDTFEKDAQRRDLTINAMGMTHEGILIDPMNGLKDLQNKVIRAVGNPTQRFVEDPLRMIRAIRFSTKYGMPMEPATYQGIIDNADLILTLSSPRLRIEIGKVLVEPNGFQMLMETGILPILMPEFRNMKDYHHKLDYHPEDTLYNHYIEAFKKFTTIKNRSEMGAWALLFHDIAKPQTAEWNEEGGYHTFYGHDKQGAKLVLDNYNNTVGPFEFSKKELQAIAWTTDNHLGKFWDMQKPMKISAIRNDERFPLLVEVVTGDTMGIRRGGDEALAARLQEINEITNKVNEQKAKAGNRPPGFAKEVIQKLGVKGKQISETLNRIEEMVSTGQVSSYDEALEVLKTKRNA